MKKLDLTEWAAISEIIGAIAVVASLIFVAQSVNRNTAQLQASSDDFLFQLTDEDFRDVALNPDLASIIQRYSQQQDLTDIETMRYQAHMARTLNRWEIAFVRHEQGFLDTESWQVWDAAFTDGFVDRFPQSWWSEWRHSVTPSFASHVDAVYKVSD